jgi:hypothetical protein
VEDVAGTNIDVVQDTNYPFDGKVAITVNPAARKSFTIRVRVPNRDVSSLYTSTPAVTGLNALAVNGQRVTPKIVDGYAEITRAWAKGDRILVRSADGRAASACQRQDRSHEGQSRAALRPDGLQHREGGPGHREVARAGARSSRSNSARTCSAVCPSSPAHSRTARRCWPSRTSCA